MVCPRCKTQMRPVEVRGVQIDLCSTCEGLWFDAGEMGAILKGSEQDVRGSGVAVSWDSEVEREEAPGAGGMQCPRCSGEMDRYRYAALSDIIVDGCEKGHGVWLDDGELRKIFDYVEEASKVDPVREAQLRATLLRIKQDASDKEEALIDSLVRWDNRPGAERYLGYPLQFIYRVLYKLGL